MGMMNKLTKDGKGAPCGWPADITKQQFSHDETGWYADIPLWPGPRGACAMVCGADTLLDLLAGENERITLRLSLEPQHLRDGNAVSGVLDYVRPTASATAPTTGAASRMKPNLNYGYAASPSLCLASCPSASTSKSPEAWHREEVFVPSSHACSFVGRRTWMR